MKYSVSQIIERAYDLGDFGNTDFLSHTELTQYINDAWTTVFNWMIGHGDKQFVAEVALHGNGVGHYTEYDLPFDFYQVLSIRNKNGVILVRHSESESDVGGKAYEIVNNRLRVYGGASDLILTYYKSPLYLTFPEKDIKVSFTGNVLSSSRNSVLLDTGIIQNLRTGETLGSVSIENGKNYYLGNGHVVKTYHTNAVLTDTWTWGQGYFGSDLTSMDEPSGEVVTRRLISNPQGSTVAHSGTPYIRSNSTGTYELRESNYIFIGDDVFSSDFVSPIDAFYSTWTPVKGGSLGSYYVYNGEYYKKVESEYYKLLNRTSGAETLDTDPVSDQTIIDNLDVSDSVNFYASLWHKDYHGYWNVTGFTTTAINRENTVINPSLAYDDPSTSVKEQFEFIDALEEEETVNVAYLEYRLAAGEYLEYTDFNGNTLYTRQEDDATYNLIYDNDYNIYYQVFSDNEFGNIYCMESEVKEYNLRAIQINDDDVWTVEQTDDGLYNIVSDEFGIIYTTDYTPVKIVPTDDWELNRAFIVQDNKHRFHTWVLHWDRIEDIPLDIRAFKTLALLSYGPLTTNGTSKVIKSHIPDTALNFPAQIYFSLLSCDLALRFACKMNANTDGLNSLYTNMKFQFRSSIDADGDYNRIKNVYR